MNRPTVGSIVTELSQKAPESRDPIEIQREMQKDYMKHLMEAVDRGYKRFPGDFFIHVETKLEPLLHNTIRNYFIDKAACPTPNYDQTVFRYNRKAGQIEYIWTIPDRETCHHLMEHALEVVPEERELLKFVMKFADGTLYSQCMKINNELHNTPIILEIKEKE